jgi:hypothetical protein
MALERFVKFLSSHQQQRCRVGSASLCFTNETPSGSSPGDLL